MLFHLVYEEVFRVVGAEMEDNQGGGSGYEGQACQHLAHPEGTPPQAVGAHSFNNHPSEAVPGQVAQGNLTIIFPLLGEKMQEHKADKIPYRLIVGW